MATKGDYVKVLNVYGRPKFLIGEIGKIVDIIGQWIIVRFENKDFTSALTYYKITNNWNCYMFEITQLEIIDNEDDSEFEDDPEVYEEYDYKKDQFEVGDNVIIKKTSRYYMGSGQLPLDVVGKVYRVSGDDHPFKVEWDENGRIKTNSYNLQDLELYMEPDDDSEFEYGFNLDEKLHIKSFKNFNIKKFKR